MFKLIAAVCVFTEYNAQNEKEHQIISVSIEVACQAAGLF
jgi:hypothetical protein